MKNPNNQRDITFVVSDGENPISGATVTIGESSETTDSDGEATFTLDDYEQDPDTYTATISKTHYVTATKTFEVTKDEEFDIVLEALPILTLTVTDGTNPVSGATVTIGTDEETSDSDGVVEFELAYGDYSATIEATGYTTATESLAFRSNHKNFTVTLESSGGGTGTVTVTATVDDGETQYPLTNEGMVVLATAPIDWTDPDESKFVAMPIAFDDNGTATLALVGVQSTDIPFGNYYLCANYNDGVGDLQYSGTLTVDGDEEVTITLLPVDEGDG